MAHRGKPLYNHQTLKQHHKAAHYHSNHWNQAKKRKQPAKHLRTKTGKENSKEAQHYKTLPLREILDRVEILFQKIHEKPPKKTEELRKSLHKNEK